MWIWFSRRVRCPGRGAGIVVLLLENAGPASSCEEGSSSRRRGITGNAERELCTGWNGIPKVERKTSGPERRTGIGVREDVRRQRGSGPKHPPCNCSTDAEQLACFDLLARFIGSIFFSCFLKKLSIIGKIATWSNFSELKGAIYKLLLSNQQLTVILNVHIGEAETRDPILPSNGHSSRITALYRTTRVRITDDSEFDYGLIRKTQPPTYSVRSSAQAEEADPVFPGGESGRSSLRIVNTRGSTAVINCCHTG